jgi:uncharacterized protein (DUF952 family)
MIVVHLLSAEDWQAAVHRGDIAPATLSTEGFVHRSTPEQAADTVTRVFPSTDGLFVAEIDTNRLDNVVSQEPTAEGVFPHVYGSIPPRP